MLFQKSVLIKQLMNHLHSKKWQERTLPASLRMRCKTVEKKRLEQKTLSLADLDFPLYVPKGRYFLAGRGQVSLP
ncbi:MAG: hypothetical protein I8H95_00135 [Rhodocyclales bacterium]|nr:hypothetical protein [Rhodocyclales bacterium]